MHGCPKQFQLDKLGARGPKFSSVTFAFGHAVGAGIQTLLAGGHREQAIWAAFLKWDVALADELEKAKKSFYWTVHAIDKFIPYAQNILNEWEVAYFNGKPAIELSFKLLLPNGFIYRAHIDIVLRHKLSGKFMVVELKTTGMSSVHPATFGNSAQALSYSLVLDKISEGESMYDVLYLVYKSKEQEVEPLNFTKNNLDKAKWIKNVLMDCQDVDRYIQEDFWPQYGENCVQYFQPCKYYEQCGLDDMFLLAPEDEILERIAEEDAKEYTFVFTLDDIIQQQLVQAEA